MSGRGALNWRQQALVNRAISLGADGDGRMAVTLPYPVESQIDLRQNPDAGLHPQKSCSNWPGVSPGDPHPRDSHTPATKAENCRPVRFSDFRWVCAALDRSHTVLLRCAWSVTCVCVWPFGEGNGNPLQCSCQENPTDGGAWWAAVYGVAQSRTRLK